MYNTVHILSDKTITLFRFKALPLTIEILDIIPLEKCTELKSHGLVLKKTHSERSKTDHGRWLRAKQNRTMCYGCAICFMVK